MFDVKCQGDTAQGTFEAYDRKVCPELMRTIEISAVAYDACIIGSP